MWNEPWPQPEIIRIPISSTWITDAEKLYVTQALESNWIGSNGHFNREAEYGLTNLIGAKTLLVSNGSVALTISLKALGIMPGDEVIVPSLTYAATASAVVNAGAVPVFVDVDKENWGITLENFKLAISSKTKCVIVVFLYGTPYDISDISRLAREMGIHVIADCAEAFLATQDNKQIGIDQADICTFSFFSNKLITSGEGGAVSSNNHELISRIELLRGQGMDPSRRYYFLEAGFNFRMSNIHAAILTAQVSRFKEIHTQRESVENEYVNTFARSAIEIVRPSISNTRSSRSPWIFTVRFPGITLERKMYIASKLAEAGIETRPVFYPLPEMKAFEKFQSIGGDNSRTLAREGISLPTGIHVGLSEVNEIVALIKEVYNE